VDFKSIPGWNIPPTNQTWTVVPDQLTNYTAFYSVTNPVLVAKLVANAALDLGITGTTGTVYRIERRTNSPRTAPGWR
jgi:hypothetical protein